MCASLLATIIALAWTSSGAFGQGRDGAGTDLRHVVAALSDDRFAVRERATVALWQAGDRTLAAEIVAQGTTAEARRRAAQVLSAYRWGIVPGISDFARAQIEAFRGGSLLEKQLAMSQLMLAGHLQMTARCLMLVSNPVARDRLNEHLRTLLEQVVPRQLVLGHADEIESFLTTLAPEIPDYHRDLRALKARLHAEPVPPSESAVADDFLLEWWLPVQSGGALEQLRQLRTPARDAWIFALLIDQQRVAEAIDTLRIGLQADADTPTLQVLRDYLAIEAANAKVQHFSKKALGLAHDSDYSPTGIALTDGFREVISFCHAFGLKSLIEDVGEQLAAQLQASPAALPAFCAWAAHYPELRRLAIESATVAHKSGVPARFAYGPLCDAWSITDRFFGQFITARERRNLLIHGVRDGGWGALTEIDAAILPLHLKGRLAMSSGDWTAAATAFCEGVEAAATLQEGAVLAYFASFSFGRSGNPEMATEWRAIAEAIPLANDRARSALADSMQRLGDESGALRNRRQLILLYQGGPDVDPAPLMHTLRLTARSLNLSDPSDLAFAPRVTERSASRTGEIAQDAAFFYRCRLASAIAAGRWEVAAIELQAAHRSAPGRLEVFEQIGRQLDNVSPELLGAAQVHLALTQELWEQAGASLPGNVAIARLLGRCRFLIRAFEQAAGKR